MKIKNDTFEKIVIICDNNEFPCNPRETINIDSHQNEIYIKSAEAKTLSSHFKVLKHLGKDSVKGNVVYFNPGFFFEYTTKITLNPDIKEISVAKFELTIHSLLICRIFTTKEKLEKSISFEKNTIKNLLLLFISLFAVPCCGATGFFTVISACGIFFDFDWSLIVATVILSLFLWIFISLSRSLYRCANPDKYYGKILKDGKQIIIEENKKHFISYIETN